MSKSIGEQIKDLKIQTDALEDSTNDISSNISEKDLSPYSVVGGDRKSFFLISDVGLHIDGYLIWNDKEAQIPAFGTKLAIPTKGYLRHFHTRYAGGALDINALELVEYDIDWDTDPKRSKHSQQTWNIEPKIKTVQNSYNENVDKIGNIDFVFDADYKAWGVSAYEINVDACYIVQYDPDTNEVKLDENGNPMKSLMFNANDPTKSSLIWDNKALVWRFLAVYSSDV